VSIHYKILNRSKGTNSVAQFIFKKGNSSMVKMCLK